MRGTIRSIFRAFEVASAPHSIARAIATSISSQLLSSATNFGVAFLLVRELTPAEFGAYGVGLSAVLFFAGIGQSLFVTQMVLRLPDVEVPRRLEYCASLLGAAATCGAFAIVIAELISITGDRLVPQKAFGFELVAAVAWASAGLLLREFCSRYFYSTNRELAALGVTFVATIAMVVAFIGLGLSDEPITAASALMCHAASSIAGALSGLIRSRLLSVNVNCRQVWNALIDSIVQMRWAAAVHVTYAVHGQAYTYIAVFIVGAAGVGAISAARLLIAPVLLAIPAVQMILMPRLALLRAEGSSSIRSLSRVITVALTGIAFLYCVAMLASLERIVPLVLGPQYAADGQVADLTPAWCLFLFATIARGGASQVLQAQLKFRMLWMFSAVGAGAAVIAALALGYLYGAVGIVCGIALGELTLWGALSIARSRHGRLIDGW